MKKAVIFTTIVIGLMTTAFLSYREGYKDGKENKFDA